MYKAINFYDKSIDIFYVEAGTSLKEALGKDFKKIAEKFLEGVDKAFFELPVEKEYKNLFNYSIEDLMILN